MSDEGARARVKLTHLAMQVPGLIADTWPPPHTSVQPRSAMAAPSDAASSSNSGCVGEAAQYTATVHWPLVTEDIFET